MSITLITSFPRVYSHNLVSCAKLKRIRKLILSEFPPDIVLLLIIAVVSPRDVKQMIAALSGSQERGAGHE